MFCISTSLLRFRPFLTLFLSIFLLAGIGCSTAIEPGLSAANRVAEVDIDGAQSEPVGQPTETLPAPSPTNLPPTSTSLPPTATILPTETIPPTPTTPVDEVGVVTDIVDGDTIKVDLGDRIVTVRYTGIDTPEMDEPCGQDAAVANAFLVMGKTVRLQQDISYADRYGRLLRYVYVDDMFINAELVRQGWAVAKRYPPDTAMAEQLEAQQAVAQTAECVVALAPLPTNTSAPQQPTLVPPTVPPQATAVSATVQPAASPSPQPTQSLPTPTPEPPIAAGGVLVIIGVDKRAEVVTIRNDGGEVNLSGWLLRSEKGSQDCYLGGVIGSGQILQIWALSSDVGQGGFNCGFGSNIWNNSEADRAILFNPAGEIVATFP